MHFRETVMSFRITMIEAWVQTDRNHGRRGEIQVPTPNVLPSHGEKDWK